MNDDYLWDKSGQPDPQIQQLEEILGTLRYQPRPLELPDDIQASRRRNYFPWVAIAASVLLAIIAGGVWLRVRSRSETPPKHEAWIETPKLEEAPKRLVNKSAVNPPKLVANNRRRNKSASSALREREEALMAKEQLMLALRVASEKLNLVHRKTQIKNQHRVG